MNENDAFASFLTGLVIAYRRPDVDHHALSTHLQNLIPAATPRFKTTGADKRQVQKLIGLVSKGLAAGTDGMPSRAYAQQLLLLKNSMKSSMREFYVHPDVPEAQASIVRMLNGLLTPDTGTVERKDVALNKKLNIIPDRVLRVWFNPTVKHDQQKKLREASKLVMRMVGRQEPALKPTETKDAKAANPETYKKYLKVRGEVNSAFQEHVRNVTREAGGPVGIKSMIRSMKSAGITYHPYHGLEGLYLGEDGKLYTAKPHRLISASVGVGSKIIMNPAYDPKTDSTYVFRYQVAGTKRAANDLSSAYTVDFTRVTKNKRFDLVTQTIQKMPSLRPRWVRDLKSRDWRTQQLAAMVETLYSQAMRIGGKGNRVDDVETFGLSTLRVNHVTVRNGTVILQYPGKDAVQQKHVLTSDDHDMPETAVVIKIIAKAVKGKRGNDRLWTDDNGDPITSSDVNAYMRGKKLPITAHKFRHVGGTVLMTKLLDQLKVPKTASQAQVEKLVKTTAIKVGALLGHVRGETATPATALKKYVHPGLVAKFFQERGLRIPRWVPSAGRGTESDD